MLQVTRSSCIRHIISKSVSRRAPLTCCSHDGASKRHQSSSHLPQPHGRPFSHTTLLKHELLSLMHAPYRPLHTSRPHRRLEKFLLADIGEGIQEVTILEWLVAVGDKVQQFDNVCEVQSDKASVTITSRYEGVVKRLYYDVNDVAKVHQPLIDIEVEDTEGEESDGGVVGEELAEGEAIPVGGAAGEVRVGGAGVQATPAVRRIAKENRVDLAQVPGTGRDGRVLKEDVLAWLTRQKATTGSSFEVNLPPRPPSSPRPSTPSSPAPSAPAPAAALPSRPSAAPGKDVTRPVSGIQRAMARSMTAALAVPHFGYCDEVDVTRLQELRQVMKAVAAEHNVTLSLLPVYLKAASLALLQYPALNATVDAACEHVTLRASHNIGVAMDTPAGLLVPCVKDVQDRSVLEIAAELSRLQGLGARGALGSADLSGGSFTLSNIGSIGGTYAAPVIPPPTVAIGALGRARWLPRYDEAGQVARRSVMCASWAADHRVLDGATVARFSNLWKSFLEEPALLALHMK